MILVRWSLSSLYVSSSSVHSCAVGQARGHGDGPASREEDAPVGKPAGVRGPWGWREAQGRSFGGALLRPGPAASRSSASVFTDIYAALKYANPLPGRFSTERYVASLGFKTLSWKKPL